MRHPPPPPSILLFPPRPFCWPPWCARHEGSSMTCNRQASCSLGLSTFNKNQLTFHFLSFTHYYLKAYFFVFLCGNIISFDAIYFSFQLQVSLVQCPPPPASQWVCGAGVNCKLLLRSWIGTGGDAQRVCAEPHFRTGTPLPPPPPSSPHHTCPAIALQSKRM